MSDAPRSIRDFANKLRRLPAVVAEKVAEKAAPIVTEAARETFRAGENAYGVTWEPLKSGDRATLHKTGALETDLRYVASGPTLRVALGPFYTKFNVGRRPVFPAQGAALPIAYTKILKDLTADVCRAELAAA